LAALQEVLSAASSKLTRRQNLKAWPAPRKPNDTTVWHWLEQAVAPEVGAARGVRQAVPPLRLLDPGRDLFG
jgi:hypothetical protein